jgi:hypothetical protein
MRKPKTVITPELGVPAYHPMFFIRSHFRMALLLSLAVFTLASVCRLAASPVPSEKKPAKPYALIYGTVWGADSRPLYGVKIKIRRANEKKVRWELYSDHNGEFALRVPAEKADYVVSADLKGYKFGDGPRLKLDQDIIVNIVNDERVDIGLHLTQ